MREKKDEKIETLEGKIIKAKTSQIPYSKVRNMKLGYHRGQSDFSVSLFKEIEYVLLETPDKQIHTFVYPSSKPILERDAKIIYSPLQDGKISHDEFLVEHKDFLGGSFICDFDEKIFAEGIIKEDGIIYK